MRVALIAALLALLPVTAWAQADCGQLKMVNSISMVRNLTGSQDFVPILFDAGQKYFLFDTGGSRTQVTLVAAQDMNLHIADGTTVMTDATGHRLAKMARIDEFVFGHLKSGMTYFPVTPMGVDADGLLALDYLLTYDADVDFGTDTLNFFSQDHCPGHVVYWQAPTVAELPLTVDMNTFHIFVPVQIDGQQLDAMIDSGASQSSVRMDIAQDQFHLTMGSADTPGAGPLNGVASMPTYQHVFKTMNFGSVAVINPHMIIMPTTPEISARSGFLPRRPGVSPYPQVIIGMDVLRKLHLYMAFKEKKLYVSAASAPGQPPSRHPDAYIAGNIQRASAVIQQLPQAPAAWASRCLWRGIGKAALDAALSDCDQSLKLDAKNTTALYARGLALYQEGKFQDARDAFDIAVTANPKSPDYLFMRGQAKEKSGDMDGGKADIAAAEAISADLLPAMQRLGLAG